MPDWSPNLPPASMVAPRSAPISHRSGGTCARRTRRRRSADRVDASDALRWPYRGPRRALRRNEVVPTRSAARGDIRSRSVRRPSTSQHPIAPAESTAGTQLPTSSEANVADPKAVRLAATSYPGATNPRLRTWAIAMNSPQAKVKERRTASTVIEAVAAGRAGEADRPGVDTLRRRAPTQVARTTRADRQTCAPGQPYLLRVA